MAAIAPQPWPQADPQNDTTPEADLIEAVRKWRPLWDNGTPLHKNVRVLVYCWQQVAEELGMHEHTIKKKWKCLRDYFFRQVRELEKNGKSYDNKSKTCLWQLYDRLKFLLRVKTNKINFREYKMTAEELGILQEVAEYDKRQRNGLETVIYHVPPSPPEVVIPDNKDMPLPITVYQHKPKQETTKQSDQCKTPPLKVILPASDTLQGKGIVQDIPETANKVTLSEPPPLRVFKHVPKILKKPDSPLIKPNSELSQPPPPKKLKLNEPKRTEPTNNTEFDADLHFFKSLLPFMRALPMKDKLRVRTGIQDLIYGELDAIKTKNDDLSQASSSIHDDPLLTPIGEDADFDQESNPTVVVKEEFEDEQSLLFGVHSTNLTFEDDDNNYCAD